jgi:hypothetical protein
LEIQLTLQKFRPTFCFILPSRDWETFKSPTPVELLVLFPHLFRWSKVAWSALISIPPNISRRILDISECGISEAYASHQEIRVTGSTADLHRRNNQQNPLQHFPISVQTNLRSPLSQFSIKTFPITIKESQKLFGSGSARPCILPQTTRVRTSPFRVCRPLGYLFPILVLSRLSPPILISSP